MNQRALIASILVVVGFLPCACAIDFDAPFAQSGVPSGGAGGAGGTGGSGGSAGVAGSGGTGVGGSGGTVNVGGTGGSGGSSDGGTGGETGGTGGETGGTGGGEVGGGSGAAGTGATGGTGGTAGCGNSLCDGIETCETCFEDCGDCAPCDQTPSGDAETRIMFQTATVPYGQECLGEVQVRLCFDGQWSDWSGTFTNDACTVEPPPCTSFGVSPELAAQSGGPYQNCQGGTYPSITISDTSSWSGCCSWLVRECYVSGFSTDNRLYCDDNAPAWCMPDASDVCTNIP